MEKHGFQISNRVPYFLLTSTAKSGRRWLMATRRQRAEEQRRSAIERRVGRTPEQRLRWAVEGFLRADLKTEIPEDLAAYGVYLKAFVPQPSKPGEVVTASLGSSEGLTVEQVKRIQAQLSAGLTRLTQQ